MDLREVEEITAPPAQKSAMAKIGRQLLRLRLYWGWTQAEVGRRAKLSQSTISRLERGVQRGISMGRLAAVMKALRVSDVTFDRPPTPPQTRLELMLRGDPWKRAVIEADRRLDCPAPIPQRPPTRFPWDGADDDAA
jgi:transcriptional regulator with XRE-family HTH domain